MPGVQLTNLGRLTIRGGLSSEVGYQLDGVNFTEPFLNGNGSNGFFNGLASLQVVAGAGDASQGNIGGGVVNVVVQRGTYPASGLLDLELGGPSSFHQTAIQYGFATPNGRFSDYVSYVNQRYVPYFGGRTTSFDQFGQQFALQPSGAVVPSSAVQSGFPEQLRLQVRQGQRPVAPGAVPEPRLRLVRRPLRQQSSASRTTTTRTSTRASGSAAAPRPPTRATRCSTTSSSREWSTSRSTRRRWAANHARRDRLQPLAVPQVRVRQRHQRLDLPGPARVQPPVPPGRHRVLRLPEHRQRQHHRRQPDRLLGRAHQDAELEAHRSSSAVACRTSTRSGTPTSRTRRCSTSKASYAGAGFVQQASAGAFNGAAAVAGATSPTPADYGGACPSQRHRRHPCYLYNHGITNPHVPSFGIGYNKSDQIESGVFIRDQWTPNAKLKFDLGLRRRHDGLQAGRQPVQPDRPGQPGRRAGGRHLGRQLPEQELPAPERDSAALRGQLPVRPQQLAALRLRALGRVRQRADAGHALVDVRLPGRVLQHPGDRQHRRPLDLELRHRLQRASTCCRAAPTPRSTAAATSAATATRSSSTTSSTSTTTRRTPATTSPSSSATRSWPTSTCSTTAGERASPPTTSAASASRSSR